MTDPFPGTLSHRGYAKVLLADRMPQQVRHENLELVIRPLLEASLPAFIVRTDSLTRYAVAVFDEHREAALNALTTAHRHTPAYVEPVPARRPQPRVLVSHLANHPELMGADVLRLFRSYATRDLTYGLGPGYGCDLEFWRPDAHDARARVAPRENVAASVIDESQLRPSSVRIGGRTYPTATVFNRRMIEDITFEIDAVYAWVDGDDPTWLAKKHRAGNGGGWHPTSTHAARFRSRDELKYSLRSLEMYAPWIRNIYLITDAQVPDWFDRGGRVRLIDHADLFEGASLPTFNSHVISSFLHRIDGLSEHFLYLNDDVFFGRPVAPGLFFTPAGQARVFPSRVHRGFGPATPGNQAHLNVAQHTRQILEREFGVTLTRAVRHTPVALLRSRLARLEELFADEYAHTRQNQFRSDTDVAAGLLFHYYAQIVGEGVVSQIDYNYVNVGDASRSNTLQDMLRKRERDVFCLNDAETSDRVPMSEDQVRDFLVAYFPTPSSAEHVGPAPDK